MKIAALGFIAFCLACRCETLDYAYQHGTVVVTFAARDGFVMAADGLTIFQGTSNGKPVTGLRADAEPKIAVCGRLFLCGMAGMNPIIKSKRPKFEYHFQQWISAIQLDHQSSPKEFSKIIQDRARDTFGNIAAVQKDDPMWKLNDTFHELIRFQIAGYAGEAPQVCRVLIQMNLKTRRPDYPEPTCITPQLESDSPTYIVPIPLNLGDEIKEANREGTPQQKRFFEILPISTAAAVTLLPNAPEPRQKIVGASAAYIQLTEEYHPDITGGITTPGTLWKGELPTVFQFPDF
jgi:hypothetical protein